MVSDFLLFLLLVIRFSDVILPPQLPFMFSRNISSPRSMRFHNLAVAPDRFVHLLHKIFLLSRSCFVAFCRCLYKFVHFLCILRIISKSLL